MSSSSTIGTIVAPEAGTPAVGPLTLRRGWRMAMTAWLGSLLSHLVLLLVLGLIVLPGVMHPPIVPLVAEFSSEPPPEVLAVLEVDPTPDIADQVGAMAIDPGSAPMPAPPTIQSARLESELQVRVQPEPLRTMAWRTGELATELDYLSSQQLGDVRGPARRYDALMERGGTEESEQAVARALEWILRHQLADGSWSFDHRLASKRPETCENPGNLPQARVAATSMALLPLLGAGQTHKQGIYKKQIQAGLVFLVGQIRPTRFGGSLDHDGGRLYSQGLAAIALCEAYAMTGDRELMVPAQMVLNYIVAVQDPQGGGWRYVPGQAGDTSVLGWQLMALKSGHLAYGLQVPPAPIAGVTRFLDHVQGDGGASYGYVDNKIGTIATSAIGLLCRMYLGWQRDEPALKRGIDQLARQGPDPVNMYYNYYATQVMHHYGGQPWHDWNVVMRDRLIEAQVKQGPEAGSWFFDEGFHSQPGGRLYSTSLSAMTLEVYYRHLPLYGSSSTESGF